MTGITEASPGDSWAIGDVEPLLARLETLTGFLGHLAASDAPVTEDQLRHIQTDLIGLHRRLKALWQKAWEEWADDRTAQAATLAAAQAAKAAPGSPADVKHAEGLWRLLRAAAETTLNACDKPRAAAGEMPV